jgi:hypothetical protein
MAENVRILVNRGQAMVWPPSCPRCGSKENLVAVQSTADRESFSLWLSHLSVETESLAITSLACRDHAWANEIGISLWKKSAAMVLLRMLIYCACALALLVAFNALSGKVPLSGERLGMIALGVLGALLLAWARRAAAVLPLRLDPDLDVAEIRFGNAQYARAFRIANARATNPRLVASLPFFKRPDFWKVIAVVALIVFLNRL